MAKKIKKKASEIQNGRQNAINMRLRRDILDGVHLPGSRLPTRVELQKQYRTTPVTVQRALDKMEADGFVRSEGRRGTFVSDDPPCLSKYAIVFPSHIYSEKNEGTFWQVLARLTERKRDDGIKFSLYMGLNGHTDEPDYRHLSNDLHSMRIAGIIFASSPHPLANTRLFEEILARKDLPKVAFMSLPAYPSIKAISTDPEDFLRISLDLFQCRGCRRLAVLGTLSGEGKNEILHRETELPAEAARRGMELHPEWIQVMYHRLAPRTRQLTRLLLKGRRDERPDALLILDSSLLEAATEGITELGLESPKDITVVGHCNFPEVPKVKIPVTFVGFDVNVFIETSIKLMSQQGKVSSNPPLTIIPIETRESEEPNLC